MSLSDEQKHELELGGRVTRDGRPLPLQFSPQDAVLVLSGVQLAYRNPSIGDELKMLWRKIGEKIEIALSPIDPNIGQIVAPAWVGQTLVDMGSLIVIMSMETNVNIQLTVGEVWLLVAALQLTTRHPQLPATTASVYHKMGRQMRDVLGNIHPDAVYLLDRGWNPAFDVIPTDDSDRPDPEQN